MTPEISTPAAPRKKTSARKSSAPSGINKSAEVRKIAAGMKAAGKKPRPVVIIEMLKKQGITVSSPQVSMVLKRMGFRPKRRRRSVEAAAAVTKAGSAKDRSRKVKVEDLVKAKKVVSQMGGIERALAAIEALRGFE